MAYDGDPYRILGLARGASIDEVKRAYRRLAKANHPDAAGAGALARFLAIQAAYERLVEGSAGGPDARPRGPAGTSPRSPEADPARAEATRRAYGGRAKTRRTTDDPAAGRGRAGRAAPGSPQGGGRPASPGQSATGDDTAARDPGAGRRRGKATLGSTSYDDADAGPFEPDWSGASWYGTTSGTYWTINPKEYADPRKHGPEYQARARRRSGRGPDGFAAEPRSEPDDAATADRDAASSDEARAAGPTHTTSTWWTSNLGGPEPDGEPDAAAGANPRATGEPRPPYAHDHVPDPAQALADLARALTEPRAGGLRGRIIRAFLGWLPIALGIGWLLGEITGCGRFAASCDPAVSPLTVVIQGGALVLLLLLPLAASLAASAALSLLCAAVAATLVISAAGSAGDEGSRRATLGLLLVAAWLAGLAIATVQRLRSASTGAGPVS